MEFIKNNILLIGLVLGSGIMLLLPSIKKSANGVPNLSPAEAVTLINRSNAVVSVSYTHLDVYKRQG